MTASSQIKFFQIIKDNDLVIRASVHESSVITALKTIPIPGRSLSEFTGSEVHVPDFIVSSAKTTLEEMMSNKPFGNSISSETLEIFNCVDHMTVTIINSKKKPMSQQIYPVTDSPNKLLELAKILYNTIAADE